MADKTRQVGGLWEETTDKGTLYELTLFINAADVATYTPTPVGKSPSTGKGGEDYPTTGALLFPAGTYIYQFTKRPMGDHWLFTVRACNDDYDWGTTPYTIALGNSLVNQSYDKTAQYLPAKWWGIIQFKDHSLYKDEDVLPPLKYDSSTVAAANATDLVFANAPSYDPPISTANGTVVFTADSGLPFTKSGSTMPTETEMPVKYINQTVMVHRYTVVMYRASSLDVKYYLDWNGINGTWTPPNANPGTGYSAAGLWLAVSQTIVRNGKTINNTKYDVVTRVMHMAPKLGAQLEWNSTLYPTWTWSI
jgi:hypothetical protein